MFDTPNALLVLIITKSENNAVVIQNSIKNSCTCCGTSKNKYFVNNLCVFV